MRIAIIAALGLAAATAHAADAVWKWKDANGVVHYSDQPVPGAEKVDVRAQALVRPSSDEPSPSYSSSSKAPPAVYRTLEVWKPAPEETIPNTGGQVSIGLRVDPQLRPGDMLVLYLDGQKVAGTPNSLDYEVDNIPRGAHVVVATVFDGSGRKLADSAPVTFYTRQSSISQPPVGPSVPKRR